MSWLSKDTIGKQGTSSGIIIRDEEFTFGETRITIEYGGAYERFYGAYLIRCEAPYLMHEHYCQNEAEAQEKFDQIKPFIEKSAFLVPHVQIWLEATLEEREELKKQGKVLADQFILLFP